MAILILNRLWFGFVMSVGGETIWRFTTFFEQRVVQVNVEFLIDSLLHRSDWILPVRNTSGLTRGITSFSSLASFAKHLHLERY